MTAREILTAAYAKSKKNQPAKIATEATEGLGIVSRVIRTFFQIGVRVNPAFFGDSSSVNFASPGWARPNAEAVFRIENGSGVEVVVVPIEDKTVESGKPAVYRWGQIYRTAGNASDPTSGALTFFFAKRPADLSDLDEAIDALYPEAYNELAVLEVAAWLAAKDGRTEDLAFLVPERDSWLQMYLSFLEHETMNEVRRSVTEFNVASAFPITLAGGTSVRLPGGSA